MHLPWHMIIIQNKEMIGQCQKFGYINNTLYKCKLTSKRHKIRNPLWVYLEHLCPNLRRMRREKRCKQRKESTSIPIFRKMWVKYFYNRWEHVNLGPLGRQRNSSNPSIILNITPLLRINRNLRIRYILIEIEDVALLSILLQRMVPTFIPATKKYKK